MQDVKDDTTSRPKFSPDDVYKLQKGVTNVRKLEFVIDNKVQNAIDTEKKKFEAWTTELSVDHVIFNEFGKNECKRIGISPDSIMQLAFQLALYYKENRVVATYESSSTAAFKHGRTETLRSCTMETKKACEAIAKKDCNLSASDLKNLIIECSNAHNKLSKEAVMGKYRGSLNVIFNVGTQLRQITKK